MYNTFLTSAIKQFEYYKILGEKTFDQISDEALFWQPNSESNSIAMIVQHLSGNMLSRWTDFLTTDGEKKNRNRDSEFEYAIATREEMMTAWYSGWECMFFTIKSLQITDLESIIYIRNMGCTVMEAINRQLCHYPYHIGQIVFLGKMITNDQWKSLSIPKGDSKAYNADKFGKDKELKHFTDDK